MENKFRIKELKEICNKNKWKFDNSYYYYFHILTDIKIDNTNNLAICFTKNNGYMQIYDYNLYTIGCNDYNIYSHNVIPNGRGGWKKCEPLDIEKIVDIDEYVAKLRKYIQKKVNNSILSSKKKQIKTRLFNLDNEEVIYQIKQICGDDSIKLLKEHNYEINSKQAVYWVNERPKLKKWDVKISWVRDYKFRCDTFEEVYKIIKWLENKPENVERVF